MTQSDAKTDCPFRWTKTARKAAHFLALDELTDQAIARKLGVSRSTITRLKTYAEFTERIRHIRDRLGEATTRYAVARKAARLAALDDRWSRLRHIIAERAVAPEMADVPGGTTGLLVRTVKNIGTGPNAREVEDFKVDTGLLRELREIEKQAATEAGQRVDDKPAPTANGPTVLNVTFEIVPSPPNPLQIEAQVKRTGPPTKLLNHEPAAGGDTEPS